METANCQLCGADAPRYLCQVRDDRYLKALGVDPPVATKVMCGRCGHIYANPQLDSAELTRLYRDLYRSTALGYADERPSADYLYWKQRKADDDYRWVVDHLSPGRSGAVLEIGCSEGLLLRKFADAGWKATGVEPTRSYAAYAREVYGLEIVEALFEHADLGDRRFDLIMAMAVLEHLKDPLGFLERIRGLLTEDGFAVFAVPDVFDLGTSQENRLSSPHLSLFTAETLGHMFRRAALEPVRVEHAGELLVGMARRSDGASVPPPTVPAHSLRDLKAAIRKVRARTHVRVAVVQSGQVVKRGLLRMLGEEGADAVWRTVRHLTRRQE